MRALAIIIGRAGSKGLPGKNARLLAGRPLVCHSIEAARAARCVGRVIVSTDGDAVADAAAAAGAAVIRRPAALSTDTAPVAAAVRHGLRQAGGAEAVVVVLYANVPLRPPRLIDEAVALLRRSGADSVQSYCPAGKRHPLWSVTLDGDGRVRPFADAAIDRRQELPGLLLPDGGVIAVRRDVVLAAPDDPPHAFLGADRRGIRTAAGAVVDIDTAADLAVAEALATRRAAPALRIGDRVLGPGAPPYVIAELGVNHDGSLDSALALVAAAADAGADAVKVQWFEAQRLLSRCARAAAYQAAAGDPDPAVLLRRLELPAAALRAIAERAHDLGLHAIATVFSIESAAAAAALPFHAFKTASPDIVNRPLLDALRASGRPLLVSAGASTLEEAEAATRWLAGHPHVLMQCVSAYPTPDDRASLAGRLALARVNPGALGYSDHTTAVDTGALAVASGACVLEKHLTLDRRAAGPDHAVSLEPADFRRYVALARRAHAMLGPAQKHVLDIERDVRTVSRQSVTAATELSAGHVIEPGELTVKRPGTGLAPWRLEATVGRRLARDVAADAPLCEDDLA